MTGKCGPVWIVAEHLDGEIKAVSLQLLGQASRLADQLGVSVGVILLGDDVQEFTPGLFAAGADQVYLGDAPQLANYQPELYTEMIVRVANEAKPEILLLGTTFMGRELAPLVAARLETGITAHCIELVLDDNQHLVAKVPAYGGLLSIVCRERRPQMATVARGVFPMPQLDEQRTGEIIPLAVPGDVTCKVEVLEIVREDVEGIQLETSQIIVAGGAGAE